MTINETASFELHGLAMVEDETGDRVTVGWESQTESAQKTAITYYVEATLNNRSAQEIRDTHNHAIDALAAESATGSSRKSFALIEHAERPDALTRWEARITDRHDDGQSRTAVGLSDNPAGATAFAMMTMLTYAQFACFVDEMMPGRDPNGFTEEDWLFATRSFWAAQEQGGMDVGIAKGN